jgi:hypothetical protein
VTHFGFDVAGDGDIKSDIDTRWLLDTLLHLERQGETKGIKSEGLIESTW